MSRFWTTLPITSKNCDEVGSAVVSVSISVSSSPLRKDPAGAGPPWSGDWMARFVGFGERAC